MFESVDKYHVVDIVDVDMFLHLQEMYPYLQP